MFTEQDNVEFDVRIDGVSIGKYQNKVLAEASISSLDESMKKKAVIVPVIQGGKQIILG